MIPSVKEKLIASLHELIKTFEPNKPLSTRREPVAVVWQEVSTIDKLPKNPLVSVLVTAYNNAETIERAVWSVVEQKTSFPFEILIGVDVCDDDSWTKAKECQAKWPEKVRAFHPSLNVGYEANRRHLYDVSCAIGGTRGGGYYAYCEADDAWDMCDTKLEEQVALLEKEHNCVACVGPNRIFERDHVSNECSSKYNKCKVPRYKMYERFFHTTTFVIPREMRIACHKLAPTLPTWMDICILKVLTCLGPIAYWNKVGSTYYHTGGGMYDQLNETQRLIWASRYCAELLNSCLDSHIVALVSYTLLHFFKRKAPSRQLWLQEPELMKRIMRLCAQSLPYTPRGILFKVKVIFSSRYH